MRLRNPTWTIGGIALILCGVVSMLSSVRGTPAYAPALLIGDVLWASGVTVFAIGRKRHESVVARRPLGVSMLVVVAVWPLLAPLLFSWISALSATAAPGPPLTVGVVYASLLALVPLAAGIIAVVQIARARTVPSPWRWAPAWVLLAQVLTGTAARFLLATVGVPNIQSYAGLLSLLNSLSFLAATLGLGILAIVLGARVPPETVQVFRSSHDPS